MTPTATAPRLAARRRETTAWRIGASRPPTITAPGRGDGRRLDDRELRSWPRAWNWAMDKTDIVDDAAVVPASTIKTVLQPLRLGRLQAEGRHQGDLHC